MGSGLRTAGLLATGALLGGFAMYQIIGSLRPASSSPPQVYLSQPAPVHPPLQPTPAPEMLLEQKLVESADMLLFARNAEGRETKILVPFTYYLRFKLMDHTNRAHYASFVMPNEPTVKMIAQHVTNSNLSSADNAQRILDFVHAHCAYTKDPDDGKQEYVKYPVETLIERGGDCEDLSILTASLMEVAGIQTILLDFDAMATTGNPTDGHMAVGVLGDEQQFPGGWAWQLGNNTYYYAETAGTHFLGNPANWKIGDCPTDLRRAAKIIELK